MTRRAAVRKASGENESLAELLGLQIERVDLVGAPAIRRRFVLTKAQRPDEETAASTTRWSQFQENDYTIEQAARACPRAFALWAIQNADSEGRDVLKSELALRYREPDGTPNIWGIRAALERLPVTELPAAVKSEAESELRAELDSAERELGKEDDAMPKAASVVEDVRDVAGRIAKAEDEETLATLRKEAKTLLASLKEAVSNGDIEKGVAEEVIEALESSLSDEGVTKEALEASIADIRNLFKDGDEEEDEATDEAAEEDAGVDEEEAAVEEATEESEAPAEEPAVEPEVPAEPELPGTEAEPVAEPAAEAAPESEPEAAEPEAPAEPVAQAEGMNEDEQSTLLRALQAIAPFKSKLPGGAFEQLAGAVGYKEKAELSVDVPELDELLKSDLPEPVMKALNAIPLLKSQLETVSAALEVERTQKEEAVTKLTKAQSEELERISLEKARKVALIGVGHEDLAALLLKAQTVDPELAEQLYKILATANEQVKKSGLFDVIGTTAPAPDSPLGRIEAIAREAVEKSEGKLTFEQAKAAAWKDNPELYAEYSKEHRESQGRRR